jgi:hypothetical protein
VAELKISESCADKDVMRARAEAVELGLGRIVALYHHSSTSYQIR